MSQMRSPRSLETASDWIAMLRGVAGPTLPPELLAPTTVATNALHSPAWLASFTDTMGNRRRVDRPLLGDLARVNPGPVPDLAKLDPEEAAWWALHDRTILKATRIDLNAAGPLFEALRERGIEWWTQAELSGVHALSIIGVRDRSPAILQRVERCAMWLLDEVQPDNATQWPWAVHIFAAISIDASRDASIRTAARHYAQTLVHNALVNAGQPDRFAACILWSSAEWLEVSSSRDATSLPLCAALCPSQS